MGRTVYVIPPRPPVRAFVIAAVAALLGAFLLVGGQSWHWHLAAVIVGSVILAAGVLLAVLAFLSLSRLAVRVELDDDGYRITGSAVEHTGRWLDVSEVTQSDEGSHVTIYHGNVRRTHLLFPRGDSPQIDTVLADVKAHLKASRRPPQA